MQINYITGYAGTGKSTRLLKHLQSIPLKDYDTTIVLCPTHKAAERLAIKVPVGIDLRTIHSFLGWMPSINEAATKVDHIDVVAKVGSKIKDLKHLIIDEGGMMSEEMFMEIVALIEELCDFETDDIKIDVYLDPYQLQPVKGRQIQIDEDSRVNLTTQHRSESPDVVALFTKFVHYLEGINTKDLTIPPSENVVVVSVKEAVKLFNVGEDRLLAYTNEKVGFYNKAIAAYNNITTYKDQLVQLGSLPDLVKVVDILEDNALTVEDLIEKFNSRELYMQNSNVSAKYMELEFKSLLELEGIKFITTLSEKIIPVLPGVDTSYKLSKKIKHSAIADKKNYRYVYALNKAFTMDYSFASTVHKAQGSEFNVVFLDKYDIQRSIMNGYYGTYARLMYVAISRAKKKVYIIDSSIKD